MFVTCQTRSALCGGNHICVDPQSKGASQDGCFTSMAWKHCCASSRHTVTSLRSADMGGTSSGVLLQTEKRSTIRLPVDVQGTETSTPKSDGLWQVQNCTNQPCSSPQEDHDCGTPRKCWHGTVALKVEPAHGPGKIGAPGIRASTAHGMKHGQRLLKIVKKRHLCSQTLCSPDRSTKVVWRNMILAAVHLVEQAMKIQFPDDEMCNHDDHTGKYQDNILGGAVSDDDDLLSGNEEGTETKEDLDALATTQKQNLWLLWPQPAGR